jgi:hypothetical protein
VKHCDHDDSERLRLESVRKIDGPAVPEDREAGRNDHRIQKESRQFQTEKIASESVADVLAVQDVELLPRRGCSRATRSRRGRSSFIIDHAASFSGEIVGLAGDGTLANSNAIDLRDVAFSSATESFSGNTTGGILTVRDSQGDTAHIVLGGNYTNSAFNLVSDGKGGTLVVDPPVAQSSSSNCNWGAKLDSQIAQMVQAMATSSTSQGGFDPMVVMQPLNDSSLHATIGSALHV